MTGKNEGIMRKYLFATVFCAISLAAAPAFADYKVLNSEEGQQVVFSDTKTLTIFRDSPIGVDAQLGGYFDSSDLETKGYDKLEWYSLKNAGTDSVEIETLKYDLRLPAYVSENEERSSVLVKLSGDTPSGIFRVHDINILITLTDTGHITVEIPE